MECKNEVDSAVKTALKEYDYVIWQYLAALFPDKVKVDRNTFRMEPPPPLEWMEQESRNYAEKKKLDQAKHMLEDRGYKVTPPEDVK